ncbi:hypothetical protein Trydic_g12695 [Trypoxylus dichotomus]
MRMRSPTREGRKVDILFRTEGFRRRERDGYTERRSARTRTLLDVITYPINDGTQCEGAAPLPRQLRPPTDCRQIKQPPANVHIDVYTYMHDANTSTDAGTQIPCRTPRYVCSDRMDGGDT